MAEVVGRTSKEREKRETRGSEKKKTLRTFYRGDAGGYAFAREKGKQRSRRRGGR